MAKCIMIVDDSASMRQMVSFTLKKAGYDVVEAVNGKDGCDKIKQSKVDLIVTDLNMPEMNGIDFIREVRLNPSYKFTPVLMLTTESQKDKIDEGKKVGCSGWIVKPFSPEHLLSTIQKMV